MRNTLIAFALLLLGTIAGAQNKESIDTLKELMNPDRETVETCNTVGVDEFNAVIKDTLVQLVDVRTAEEYAEGHIPGAVNIDVQKEDFTDKIKTLDKSRPVAVYCRSGRRSLTAAGILSKAGFKTIYNLAGGFLSWSAASYHKATFEASGQHLQ